MSDCIDRQAAIDEAEKWIETYNSGRGGQRERDAIKHVISGINKLPLVQPEIIRCKECKHWYDAPAMDGYNSCELDALIRHKDFFCANAERRTDETD